MANLDGARNIVLRDLGAQLAEELLAVAVLLREKDQPLDDDGHGDDRTGEQPVHRRTAPIDEADKTAKVFHAVRRLQWSCVVFERMKATRNPVARSGYFPRFPHLPAGAHLPPLTRLMASSIWIERSASPAFFAASSAFFR